MARYCGTFVLKYFYLFLISFIYVLFLALLDRHCFIRAFSSCGAWVLTMVASLIAEHQL